MYVVTDDDNKLVNLILYSKHHVLHSILPDRSDFNYNLRPRRHNLVLTAKSSEITLLECYSKTFTDADVYIYSYSVFPSTCLG